MPIQASESHINAWATEAEQGYDVALLKKRGRGRPGRGATPSRVVTVRLTEAEIAALDSLAAKKHMSRSELVRKAIADLTVE